MVFIMHERLWYLCLDMWVSDNVIYVCIWMDDLPVEQLKRKVAEGGAASSSSVKVDENEPTDNATSSRSSTLTSDTGSENVTYVPKQEEEPAPERSKKRRKTKRDVLKDFKEKAQVESAWATSSDPPQDSFAIIPVRNINPMNIEVGTVDDDENSKLVMYASPNDAMAKMLSLIHI